MYDSYEIATTIKMLTARKTTTVKQLLEDLSLGKNFIVHMAKGHMPTADSLARIADYLDCSVDYLLGRTTNPSSHKQTMIIGGKTMSFAERLREVMRIRDIGASDLATKIYGWKNNDHLERAKRIANIIDARPSAIEPTQEEIEKLADALNVAVDQLTGTETITLQNLRPYTSDLEGEALQLYTAARSLEFRPDGRIKIPKGRWQRIEEAENSDDTFDD